MLFFDNVVVYFGNKMLKFVKIYINNFKYFYVDIFCVIDFVV